MTPTASRRARARRKSVRNLHIRLYSFGRQLLDSFGCQLTACSGCAGHYVDDVPRKYIPEQRRPGQSPGSARKTRSWADPPVRYRRRLGLLVVLVLCAWVHHLYIHQCQAPRTGPVFSSGGPIYISVSDLLGIAPRTQFAGGQPRLLPFLVVFVSSGRAHSWCRYPPLGLRSWSVYSAAAHNPVKINTAPGVEQGLVCAMVQIQIDQFFRSLPVD